MYRARKKNWASIAKRHDEARPGWRPAKVRERKKLKSTIGAATRRSISTKATIPVTPRA